MNKKSDFETFTDFSNPVVAPKDNAKPDADEENPTEKDRLHSLDIDNSKFSGISSLDEIIKIDK